NLIFKIIAIAVAVVAIGVGGYFIFRKKDNQPAPGTASLGQQQNQQTQNAVLQLASNLLGNTNNLNQLTKKPGGGAKTIQEIEEEFLISAFQSGQSPVGGIDGGLSPEVIERIWEYQRIREEELLDKIKIPDLNAEKRIGATNILYVSGEEPNRIGGSCDLIIFLKPNNSSETNVNFTIDLGEYESYYKQIVRNFLTKKGKNNNAYVLVRDLTSARGDSAGIAFYLTLHSLVNRIPLPRNLGSTGTVYGTKTGAIGGLNRKLEYNIKKEKSINTFILSEENKNNEPRINKHGQSAHFTRSTSEIETALQEILKNPNEKIIHSCGKEPIPDRKPEKPNQHDPPTSEITSEQLLTLITELSIRKNEGENQDFWEKLQTAYGKNANYLEVINQAKNLRQEYLGKLDFYCG
ncbi:hypothetical protein C1645_842182, partial [Glomus cerebriforme]